MVEAEGKEQTNSERDLTAGQNSESQPEIWNRFLLFWEDNKTLKSIIFAILSITIYLGVWEIFVVHNGFLTPVIKSSQS